MDVSKKHQALLKALKKHLLSMRQREEQALQKLLQVVDKFKTLGSEYQARFSKRIVRKVKKLKPAPKRKRKAIKRVSVKPRRKR